MKATDIPFVKHVGITQEHKTLSLDVKKYLLNHVETLHASAQFTLAETQSGLFLQTKFPELEGKVIPLLRDAHIQYKKPATKSLNAYASCSEEALEVFYTQLEKRGRALLNIDVVLKDTDDTLTSKSTFTWFVQSL